MKDVVIIGGGAGGVPASIRAAQLGGEVAILENKYFGGLCMNSACVPFRHMMLASDVLGTVAFWKKMGLSFEGVSNDYSALKKRQNELIKLMRLGVTSTLKKNKIEFIEGKGKIVGKGKVEVNGRTISCRKIILATGAEWVKPDFPGGDLDDVLNTDELMSMDKLPKKVLAYGRSPWLLETAQFLNRFGSKVVVVTPDKAILSGESKTIRSRLRRVLKDEGIDIKTKTKIMRASKGNDGLSVELNAKESSETIIVDKILYTERAAAFTGLGLKNVDFEEDGEYLEVNGKMETRTEGIYAIGDLTGPQSRHYSHFSSEGGIVAAENAMGVNSSVNPMTFTRVLFTQPQVASVGLTSKEAKKLGHDVVVGAAPYGMNPYGMLLAENMGIVEVVGEKKYGEVLGTHFIGNNASEMVGQAILAIHLEATLEDLARTFVPHPTLSESLSEAARNALGRHIYLP